MTLQNRYLKLEVGPLPMSLLDSLVVLPDLFLQLGSPSVEITRADFRDWTYSRRLAPLYQGCPSERRYRLFFKAESRLLQALKELVPIMSLIEFFNRRATH